jgi:transcriptional regulator with XRE-family HTH domain
MAPNLALRTARTRAHLSQDDLARRIRDAGFKAGDPNGCTRVMVQRWESGRTRRPQGRYMLALESVLGQPASTLGFEFADTGYGMDRRKTLADAGFDTVLPLPDPAASYGPLTGIWLSSYDYFSSGRDQALTGRHHVILLHRGARLMIRSLPAMPSQLSMELSTNGQVITGTWTEQTTAEGYYHGAVYHGAIQMLQEPTGRRLAGKWVGFGRELEVNSGPWTLTLIDDHVDAAAIERWNHTPE